MGDFQREEVLYFIISKGCRVRNHELVTHFKNFLDHPINKAQNRVLFKDYVNELASVKVEGGEKVLVLKKRFRPTTGDSFRGSSTSVVSSASNSSQSSLCTSSALDSSQVTPKKKSSSEERKTDDIHDHDQSPAESPRAQSEPPPVTTEGKKDLEEVFSAASEESVNVVIKQDDSQPQSSDPSVTESNVSLVSNDSIVSTASNTSVVSNEDEGNTSVISVKDKIKKLNRMESETSITSPKGGSSGGNKKKYGTGDDDDTSHTSGGMSYITLDDEQREWMTTCSRTHYHDMNRLLSKNPALAPLKDLTNGYTALHWAAKYGKAEVIKLIANKPGVNVDQRSHGGYSPLHLAALHGHEHIIELLVQTFKADANQRDYSGRKAKQYLKNSASSKAQQLLVSRRIGHDQAHVRVNMDDSFTRAASMRMSSRAKAMSSLMHSSGVARPLRSTWAGSYEDISDEREYTPPGSGNASPSQPKRRHTTTIREVDLMPPPANSNVSRKSVNIDRSISSSQESLSSSTISLQNDENLNPARSESDQSLKQHTVV